MILNQPINDGIDLSMLRHTGGPCVSLTYRILIAL